MDLLLHLFYQGYLWGQSPAGGSSHPHPSRSMEKPWHTRRRDLMAVPSLSYCTTKPLSGCHHSCGVVTGVSPSWGALGQQQSSSAVEALLHRVALHSLTLSPERALLATGDLLLGGLF